jgi:hypothetical protein
MKKFLPGILALASILVLSGCGGGSGGSDSRRFSGTDNEISAFAFTQAGNSTSGLSSDTTGLISDRTITLEVPSGTDVTALVAEFVTNSGNVQVNGAKQVSGVTSNDFSIPVTYRVFSPAGTENVYTVKVNVAPNTVRKITAYSLKGVAGTIDESTGAITVSLPPKSDTTSLKAAFSYIGASITARGEEQVSGTTANDFTNPVTYRVTSESGSDRTYTVTVTVEKSQDKDITDFSFRKSENPDLGYDIPATICGTKISVVLPYGSSAADLVAFYATNGERVTIDGAEQQSAFTRNDFLSSKTYRVTAEDKSAKDYTVNVAVAKNSARAITSFTLDGETGIIDENVGTISVNFSSTKHLEGLTASFISTGDSVKVGETEQESDVTENDFSSPVTYRVTAEDGSTKDYTVTAVRCAGIAGLWNFEYGSDGSYTITGAKTAEGLTGSALLFDSTDGATSATNDYVLVPDSGSLTLADGGTIEVILKAITHQPSAGIVHKGIEKNFSDETYSFQFWGADNGTDGTLILIVHSESQDADDYFSVASETKLETGRWYHLLATWDSGRLAIYIDGEKDNETVAEVGRTKDSSGPVVIGAQMDQNYSYSRWHNLGFNGIIDRVEILNHSIDDDQARARFEKFQAVAGSGFSAYLLSVAGRNVPFMASVFGL